MPSRRRDHLAPCLAGALVPTASVPLGVGARPVDQVVRTTSVAEWAAAVVSSPFHAPT
jgi:hypothetical protein